MTAMMAAAMGRMGRGHEDWGLWAEILWDQMCPSSRLRTLCPASAGTEAQDPSMCKTNSASLWGAGAPVITLRFSEIPEAVYVFMVNDTPPREPHL